MSTDCSRVRAPPGCGRGSGGTGPSTGGVRWGGGNEGRCTWTSGGPRWRERRPGVCGPGGTLVWTRREHRGRCQSAADARLQPAGDGLGASIWGPCAGPGRGRGLIFVNVSEQWPLGATLICGSFVTCEIKRFQVSLGRHVSSPRCPFSLCQLQKRNRLEEGEEQGAAVRGQSAGSQSPPHHRPAGRHEAPGGRGQGTLAAPEVPRSLAQSGAGAAAAGATEPGHA